MPGKVSGGRPRSWSDTVRRDSNPGMSAASASCPPAPSDLRTLKVFGKRHKHVQPVSVLTPLTVAHPFCAERESVRFHVNARGRRVGLERRRHVTLGHPWAMGGEEHGHKGRGASVFGSRPFNSPKPSAQSLSLSQRWCLMFLSHLALEDLSERDTQDKSELLVSSSGPWKAWGAHTSHPHALTALFFRRHKT